MRKGSEYMPLRDGLITTGGPRSKASTTAARKLLGTSSPTGAGAVASLECPRPAGISVWRKQDKPVSGEGPFLQEALLGQSLCAACPTLFLPKWDCPICGRHEAPPSSVQRSGKNRP